MLRRAGRAGEQGCTGCCGAAPLSLRFRREAGERPSSQGGACSARGGCNGTAAESRAGRVGVVGGWPAELAAVGECYAAGEPRHSSHAGTPSPWSRPRIRMCPWSEQKQRGIGSRSPCMRAGFRRVCRAGSYAGTITAGFRAWTTSSSRCCSAGLKSSSPTMM